MIFRSLAKHAVSPGCFVPMVWWHGQFRRDYAGLTLRDHLGPERSASSCASTAAAVSA